MADTRALLGVGLVGAAALLLLRGGRKPVTGIEFIRMTWYQNGVALMRPVVLYKETFYDVEVEVQNINENEVNIVVAMVGWGISQFWMPLDGGNGYSKPVLVPARATSLWIRQREFFPEGAIASGGYTLDLDINQGELVLKNVDAITVV